MKAARGRTMEREKPAIGARGKRGWMSLPSKTRRRIVFSLIGLVLLLLVMNLLSRHLKVMNGGTVDEGKTYASTETTSQAPEDRISQGTSAGESGDVDQVQPGITEKGIDPGDVSEPGEGDGDRGPTSAAAGALDDPAKANGENDGKATSQVEKQSADQEGGGTASEEPVPSPENVYRDADFEVGESAPDIAKSLVKVALSLVVVAFLILGARGILRRTKKRFAAEGEGGHLRVLAYVPLGNGRGIYEVQVGGMLWLIGEGEKGLSCLGSLSVSELPEGEGLVDGWMQGDFRAWLQEDLASIGRERPAPPGKGWLDALRWKTARK